MQNIKSMEAELVEIKKKTKSCRDNTLVKLDELYKVLTEEEENSEETATPAKAGAESGGQ